MPLQHASISRFSATGVAPWRAWFLAALMVHPIASQAGSLPAGAVRNLGDLSIEQLMNESVTSVAKKETRLFDSPAAIAIVTGDDVRRLGVTSLPEALRLVPGLEVARINASKWGITSRGFNSQFANKLLVLVDGRAVYTPAFAGVYWDAQDVVLEDLDRIEVIRGPGATLWGANAVNGVINVTTKGAKETQGLLISSTAGTEDRPGVSIRQGGRLAPEVYYRVYLKYFDREGFVDATGQPTPDDWNAVRGGVRLDGTLSAQTDFTFLADYHSGESGEFKSRASLLPPFAQTFNAVGRNRGGNVLGRWNRDLGGGSQLTLQSYYDSFDQNNSANTNRETRRTFDVELQHRFNAGSRHQFVWGAGYRQTSDHMASNFGITWTPDHDHSDLMNVFIQDEITLAPERWHLIAGSKFEHNPSTKLEVQPNLRLLWTPTRRHTLWAAASHAVRTPSRFERDVRLNVAAFRPSPVGPPFLVSLFGNPQADSEKLNALELGYRVEVNPELGFDAAIFHNDYRHLLGFEAGPTRTEATPAPLHVLVTPGTMRNSGTAHTHGAELSAQWRASDRWKLAASYSVLRMTVRGGDTGAGDSPQHQFHLRSYLDLPRRVQLNGSLSHVGELPVVRIPSYVRLDLGLRWQVSDSIEAGLWGQNLLDPRHPEMSGNTSGLRTEVPRSFIGKIIWRY
jgi:iron complex outermembrane receptor protein